MIFSRRNPINDNNRAALYLSRPEEVETEILVLWQIKFFNQQLLIPVPSSAHTEVDGGIVTKQEWIMSEKSRALLSEVPRSCPTLHSWSVLVLGLVWVWVRLRGWDTTECSEPGRWGRYCCSISGTTLPLSGSIDTSKYIVWYMGIKCFICRLLSLRFHNVPTMFLGDYARL